CLGGVLTESDVRDEIDARREAEAVARHHGVLPLMIPGGLACIRSIPVAPEDSLPASGCRQPRHHSGGAERRPAGHGEVVVMPGPSPCCHPHTSANEAKE